MIRALRTSATGMKAQEVRVDVIANNLANVNTAGFKKSQAQFQDLLYQTVRPAGVAEFQGQIVPTELQVGHGTRLASTQKVFTQGNMQKTQNNLQKGWKGNLIRHSMVIIFMLRKVNIKGHIGLFLMLMKKSMQISQNHVKKSLLKE